MESSSTASSTKKHPIFNNEWEILSSLGEGNTSKVYKARNLKSGEFVALKLLREEFLTRDSSSIKSVEQEIQILQGLKHDNIVNILGYGSDGHVKKPSGREINNLVYILLVDDNLNLKVADFGFATYKKINKLNSYRGTMTYMAPEIKEGKTYDGRQIDMFSTGVILFIIVQGIFPFKEAKKDEYFYNLILQGKLEQYWKKVGGNNLSDEFKDLILKMFSYDGNKRPTIAELKEHPWIKKPFSVKLTRASIIDKLHERRSEKTAHMSKEDEKNYRGGDMKELVR